jgi:hypothetical protein
MWRNGTAVSYALRITDIHRFATPDFLTDSVVLSELLTYGTLALEVSLGILVWNRAARPWVLALGISMHVGIDLYILVGFFSFAMIVTYIAFIPAEAASRRIIALRDRFAEGRVNGRHALSKEPCTTSPAPLPPSSYWSTTAADAE